MPETNIFAAIRTLVIEAVESIGIRIEPGADSPFARVTSEPPRDASHGDVATNAAMVLAKAAGENPRALAERIAERLRGEDIFATVDVAGPGFINIRLSNRFWHRHLAAILEKGVDYGRTQSRSGQEIDVEYVSANPTGPMHVGHCRGAVVGDVIANLLAFAGAKVTKEYYINDAGAQIDVLARSVWLRYLEALGETITEIPAGLYPGEYLVPVGKALAADYGASLKAMPEGDAMQIVRDRSVDAMMDMIRADLEQLNVRHDVFFSERGLHANGARAIRTAINELTLSGHVYHGKLPPPKGQTPEDWEDREQVLFRSTAVGDDIDRPLQKSDGTYTYFAADVAYLKDKHDRGFDEMIFVLGADHGGYVKRMEALNQAITGGRARLTVVLCNLVKLYRDGEPVRMSKRSGEFVTLREVVEEVGRDPVRFMMIYRKNMEPLDFDFARVTEQSKDNPVFYVQYASARCHSVLRQAEESLWLSPSEIRELAGKFELLTDEGEIGLIRKLAEYPRVIEGAAQNLEPHRLAFYLYDLASALHAHWNRGTDRDELRFIKVNDPESTAARLGLVRAVLYVLISALGLIGANAPEEMR